MTTQMEVAADLLFPSQGNGNPAANIKFFSGWSRTVCAEQLATEFLSVESQIKDERVEPSDGIDD